MENYRQRIADKILSEHLSCIGAVLIEGPKWCGKTTTALQQSSSVVQLQDPDKRAQYDSAISTKPSLLLVGQPPLLIDEWQMYPILWDAVRTEVDRRSVPGQFILTGSNSVNRDQIMHSGTGRISRLRMLPMSLYESGESSGEISLKALFDNPEMNIDGCISKLTVEDLVFASCRGGWPGALAFNDRKAQLFIAKTYLDSICSEDAYTIDGVRRDPLIVRAILRSYARNVSTLAKRSALLLDIRESTSCSDGTLVDYLEVLKRLFVIDDIPAWNPSIRSASAIRAGEKRQFVDPSIAIAALNLGPEALLNDLNTFGFIFETLCSRDLKVYSSAAHGQLSYYHDRYGLEADAVLHLDDGRYALIEFKLGSKQIDDGAKHLLEIVQLIDKANVSSKVRVRKPDLLMVITGGQMAYRRSDGVLVIPISCLKD